MIMTWDLRSQDPHAWGSRAAEECDTADDDDVERRGIRRPVDLLDGGTEAVSLGHLHLRDGDLHVGRRLLEHEEFRLSEDLLEQGLVAAVAPSELEELAGRHHRLRQEPQGSPQPLRLLLIQLRTDDILLEVVPLGDVCVENLDGLVAGVLGVSGVKRIART